MSAATALLSQRIQRTPEETAATSARITAYCEGQSRLVYAGYSAQQFNEKVAELDEACWGIGTLEAIQAVVDSIPPIPKVNG